MVQPFVVDELVYTSIKTLGAAKKKNIYIFIQEDLQLTLAPPKNNFHDLLPQEFGFAVTAIQTRYLRSEQNSIMELDVTLIARIPTFNIVFIV